MPDLTSAIIGYDQEGNPVTLGANYRVAQNKFSNYGTRRLRFYTIEIDGYDIFDNEDTNDSDSRYDWNFGTTDSGNDGYHDDKYYAYKNQPKSIIEAILRGVSLVAETYYVSWYDTDYDGNYPYLYITVAVAGDTFLDAQNQPNNGNQNALGLQDSIANALGNDFNWDNIYVWPAEIQGRYLQQENDHNALSREKKQLTEAQKAERTARLDNPKTARVSRRV